jgi:hypothetical protein
MNADDDFDGVKVEVRRTFSQTLSTWLSLHEVRHERICFFTGRKMLASPSLTIFIECPMDLLFFLLISSRYPTWITVVPIRQHSV